jgi:hypothetical protein
MNVANPPRIGVSTPVSANAQLFNQMLTALSMTDRLVGQVAGMVAEDRREQERLDLEAEQYDRGLAAETTANLWPTLSDDITEGRFDKYLDDDEDYEAAADAFVAEQVDGMSDAYTEEFRRRIKPRIIAGLVDRRNSLDEKFKQRQTQLLADAATDVESPDQARKIIEQAKKLGYDEQEAKAVLMPALKAAASTGTPESVQQFNHLSQALGETFSVEQQIQRAKLDVALRQKQNQLASDAKQRIDRMIANDEPYALIRDKIKSSKAFDDTTQLQLLDRIDNREQADIREQQNAYATELMTAVRVGALRDPETLKDELEQAMLRSPDDPRYIHPTTAGSITSLLPQQQTADLKQAQVNYALAGGGANLTESIHGATMFDTLGPTNTGVLNEANQIVDPAGLATYTLRARIMPTQLSDTLIANLTSPNAQDVENAALAIGLIAQGDSGMFAELTESATDSQKQMLEALRSQWERGRLSNTATRSQAIEAIRSAADIDPSRPTVDETIIDALNRDDIDMTDEIDSIFETMRDKVGYANEWWFGWGPDLQMPTTQAYEMARNAFANQYATLRQAGYTPDKSTELAKSHAAALLKRNVDIVRWNGNAIPTPIVSDAGIRLPPALRWHADAEDILKADAEEQGIDIDDVVAVKPFLQPDTRSGSDPMKTMGWVLYGPEGNPLTDDNGVPYIFQPLKSTDSDKSRPKNVMDAFRPMTHMNLDVHRSFTPADDPWRRWQLGQTGNARLQGVLPE